MRKDTPRTQVAGSNESDGTSHGASHASADGDGARQATGEGAAAPESESDSDSKSTIQDLLRLVDELQRKSADHDGKLGELSELLTRKS